MEVCEIRSKIVRHTYCAARLQTLDQGARVSTYTVAREMGHGGEAMVRRVYGHLGRLRHRAEVVEYRVEQHAAKLGALVRGAPRDRSWQHHWRHGVDLSTNAVSHCEITAPP